MEQFSAMRKTLCLVVAALLMASGAEPPRIGLEGSTLVIQAQHDLAITAAGAVRVTAG